MRFGGKVMPLLGYFFLHQIDTLWTRCYAWCERHEAVYMTLFC